MPRPPARRRRRRERRPPRPDPPTLERLRRLAQRARIFPALGAFGAMPLGHRLGRRRVPAPLILTLTRSGVRMGVRALWAHAGVTGCRGGRGIVTIFVVLIPAP